jgi:hypothetical protein
VLLVSTGDAEAQHGHHCDEATAVASPVLSVGDFDGSGRVGIHDLILVIRQRYRHDYVAFYDRNADYKLNGWDIVHTAFELGDSSTMMDQQIASVYWGTVAFRDQDTAIAAGFMPFTPAFAGHGRHYAQHPDGGALDYDFEASNPEGLNYDADGNLWAVFYYAGADPNGSVAFNPLAAPPQGFHGHHDMWHHHAGACLLGIDYENPEMDAESLNFVECIGPAECGYLAATTGYGSTFKWNPKFHMIHLWIYELNRCGTFAGAHPDLMPEAPDPASANPTGMACNITDVVDADEDGADDDYPFSPVPQFCRWMAQIGTSIPALGCF